MVQGEGFQLGIWQDMGTLCILDQRNRGLCFNCLLRKQLFNESRIWF